MALLMLLHSEKREALWARLQEEFCLRLGGVVGLVTDLEVIENMNTRNIYVLFAKA